MKKVVLGIFGILLLSVSASAADLEAVVTNSEAGGSSGEIDLDVTGGVAPFVFDWNGPEGFSSTDEDLSGLAAGTYTVTVTDSYCGVAVLEVVVGENGHSGIQEDEPIFELSIYPNPTSGLVFLVSDEVLNVRVFNIVGEQIIIANNVTKIDLSNHPAGIYMIQVSSDKGIITRKITLQ